MLGRFDSNEFDTIELMASSGGLSVPDSDARMAYYGMSGLPHLVFNGGNGMVGAGTDVVDGSVYDPLVSHLIGLPSPVQMSISAFSLTSPGAFVTVDLALEEDLASPATTRLRVALLEDDLTYGGTLYHNILRDIVTDQALTISQAGESAQVTVNFAPNPAWNPANMRLIAFVQDDKTKEVVQSCNSLPTPDYSMRYYVAGDRTRIGAGPVSMGELGLFNAGTLDDTYDVSLDLSGLPAGWSAAFSYDGADYTSLSVPVTAGERVLLQVAIDAADSGDGAVVLTLHSQSGLTPDRSVTFKVITPDIEVLLVDDDGAEKYESAYFGPAIAAAGKSFAVWDRGTGVPPAAVLAAFDAVVWECGWAFPTVDPDDRAALTTYLEGGGNLFITGQDIGWEMTDTGGEALVWYHDVLHANYIADDTNMLVLQGVPGDPITDGMSLAISGGDGANNQQYPSDIDPRDAAASTILTYDASRNGGIKVDTGTYRLVYLAFGFEAINNAADRSALMQNALEWLVPSGSAVGDETPVALALTRNVPNPFNPMTDIRYSVAQSGHVNLAVYDVAGRRLRTLVDGRLIAGDHHVTWDGKDDAGRALPSGTYFCRVAGEGGSRSLKMSLVR
jgi:hypothetical protein